MKKVNHYEFGLYQEGEIYIDTSSYRKGLEINQGKVYLTILELKTLLKLAEEGEK